MDEAQQQEDAARRARYGEVLRRWGLLDEVNNPKGAEEFAVTDLLALVDAEQAEAKERYREGLRRADRINNELMQEVQRYAEGTEVPVLWSVYNAMHLRAANAEGKLEQLAREARDG
jgi:hypothetical protein